MAEEKKAALESDYDESKDSSKRNLKMNNSKSRFSSNKKEEVSFEERANEVISSAQERRETAVTLVSQFWKIFKDQQLIDNKGPVELNIEKDTVSQLLNFASMMNNDAQEPEGSGSIAIISLLLKSILHLRNTNNELSYKVHKLEQQINKLSSLPGSDKT